MEVVDGIESLRVRLAAWRRAGETLALVPTMGALHEGHLALIRRARSEARRTCVSIFVNPTQFGPGEDLDRYPRSPERDRSALEAEGVDLLFSPTVAEMYPPGDATRVRVVGGLADTLEGSTRPGHFEGVATVVTKLLLVTLPDVAVFGEKDYQQLQLIHRLVADLRISTRVGSVPTVRESDGLALSSRNQYLSAAERAVAPILHRTISSVADAVRDGASPAEQCARGRAELESAGFGPVDYLAVRDAVTLEEPGPGATELRVLSAAWLGRTRLIDNIGV